MRVILPGGSGQLGQLLARQFSVDGHEVVVLSRSPGGSLPWRVVPWDAETVGEWAQELNGADVVINLTGRSVNCRYTTANRKAILDSRVNSTRVVGEAISRCPNPPRVWLQMSTATIYAHRYDAPNDEFTGKVGGDEPDAPDTWKFSIDVATAWERSLCEADTPNTRKVAMRAAMTMTPDAGGVFDVLMGLVKKRLGGTNGDGRQYVSWIHGDDFVRAVYHLIENDRLNGPVNVCSPNPLPNAAFMRELRRAAGIRIGLPATRWMLELGAVFLGTETELLLKSRRVVPTKLQQSGFAFRYPTWPEAASDLYRRWREFRQHAR